MKTVIHILVFIDLIECDESIISTLIKLDKDKFLYGSMNNNTAFLTRDEENDSYKIEKKITIEPKDEHDCIYAMKKYPTII